MWNCPIELRGLGLHSLEIESVSQVANLFVSLYAAKIPIQSLLRVIIEYVQLKIGVVIPFFSLPYKDFKELVIRSWIATL